MKTFYKVHYNGYPDNIDYFTSLKTVRQVFGFDSDIIIKKTTATEGTSGYKDLSYRAGETVKKYGIKPEYKYLTKKGKKEMKKLIKRIEGYKAFTEEQLKSEKEKNMYYWMHHGAIAAAQNALAFISDAFEID